MEIIRTFATECDGDPAFVFLLHSATGGNIKYSIGTICREG